MLLIFRVNPLGELPQNSPGQLTLFEPGGADYAHNINTSPPPPDSKSYLHLCKYDLVTKVSLVLPSCDVE